MHSIIDALEDSSAESQLVMMPHVRVGDGKVTSVLSDLDITIDASIERLLEYAGREATIDDFIATNEDAMSNLVTALQDGVIGLRPAYDFALRAKPAKGTWLVLSPHPDDAALSVGGTLFANCPFYRLDVATLTSTYRYSPSPQLRGNIEELTTLRHAEEALFCSFIDANKLDGGLLDADIRPEGEGESVFRDPKPAEQDLYLELLAKLVAEREPDRIYAPWGLAITLTM